MSVEIINTNTGTQTATRESVELGTAHQGEETLILGAVEAEKGILLLQVVTEHLEMRVTQGNCSVWCQGVTEHHSCPAPQSVTGALFPHSLHPVPPFEPSEGAAQGKASHCPSRKPQVTAPHLS